MPRRPAAFASLFAACLVSACGACASGAGAPAATAKTGSAATPARPAASAQVETASLRRGGGKADRGAALWAGCYEYKGRTSCPDGNFEVGALKQRAGEAFKTVDEARKSLSGSVDIDGVPTGRAYAHESRGSAGFSDANVKSWTVLPTEASADEVLGFKCWSHVGSTSGEAFCRRASAHFVAGTLPTSFPSRDETQVTLFGTETEVFEDGYSPGHGAVLWDDGAMFVTRYDDQAAALDARAATLAYAKTYTSAELFDFRCSVAGVEGDCVLVQASVGSTGRVIRVIASALRGPSNWYLFSCQLRTTYEKVEPSYEASCGTLLEVLPSE